MSKSDGRVLLPSAIKPIHYDITLSPDLEKFTFAGSQVVRLAVSEKTNVLQFHISELYIKSAVLTQNGVELTALEHRHDIKLQVFSVILDGEVVPGEAVLKLEFDGCLNNQMMGFYRSSYKDIHGKSKIMASTQFEPTSARRCFPCWDEPAQKAVFKITVVVDEHLTAFSNMPETCSKFTTVNGVTKREISFMDSPKMSTYLVALVVGEFDYVSAVTKDGVTVRVYSPPGRSSESRFALDTGVRCLDLYNEFFGVPYCLPKLDMVAIPEFAMGAMENWGLVTYREVDLMVSDNASSSHKQRVAIVVAHEIAHQWFGNLVTMQWWDDLWLNEGFASWCENYCVDALFPEYKMWEQFAADTLAGALRLDALRTSHPIQVPIQHANDVEEVFDVISYNKGASVIRMAHAVMGREKFQRGLQNYMKTYQFGNTETYHLWDSWSASSGVDMRALMSSWTEQMGFPLITVQSTSVASSMTLQFTQTWFLADGSTDDGPVWSVPIFITTRAGAHPLIIMSEKTMSVTLDVGDSWVKVNAGHEVPIRVLYDDVLNARIISAITAKELGETDRGGFLMDSYALTKARRMSFRTLMEVLVAFKGELEYTVWDALATCLSGIERMLSSAKSELHSSFVAFAARVVKSALSVIGWDVRPTDGHLDKMLRGRLVQLSSQFLKRDIDVLAEARARYKEFQKDVDTLVLPDDYRIPVFAIVAANGGEKEYEELYEVWKKAKTSVAQNHVYKSIGAASTPKLRQRAMEWAISGDVKLQDFFYIFMSVSCVDVHQCWEFVTTNFAHIQGMLKTSSPSLMETVISIAAGGFASIEKAEEISAFFAQHKLNNVQRTIAQTIEGVRTNATFVSHIASSSIDQSFWEALASRL